MSYNEPGSPGSLRRLTNRNTNRHSVTALFSMAAEQDVEVGDDLSRGKHARIPRAEQSLIGSNLSLSTKAIAGFKGENLGPVEEELCPRQGRTILG